MIANFVSVYSICEPNATTLSKHTTYATCQYNPIASMVSNIAPMNMPVEMVPEESYILVGGERIMKFHDEENNIDYIDGQAKHNS